MSWFVTVYRSSVHSCWITKQFGVAYLIMKVVQERQLANVRFQFFPIVEAERCRWL